MYPPPADYLARIDFDVTAAQYWTNVNTPPPGGLPDFRLNAAETACLQRNGFVASGRLGASCCLELYYGIFRRDLPVFITTDSILQAWHRSYDAILQDLETTYLSQSLAALLEGMAGQMTSLAQAYGAGELKQSVLDADYYLAVARSLLAGTNVPSRLGQDGAVATTLAGVESLSIMPFNLFGRLEKDPNYLFDFSQFKPRGHYTNSRLLQRYFQAMMWCGRVDLRVAGNTNYASPRELGTAMVLNQALRDAAGLARWRDLDRLLQVLVGPVDSMTFIQLDALLQTSPIKRLADVGSLADLAAVQQTIENGSLGFQEILSDFYTPLSTEQLKLPRSFTVLGQRFTQDSWALGTVVYDHILWKSGSAVTKVPRRIPSGLDVIFAAFANDQVTPELVARMTNPNGRRLRDGLPYQHNLVAARRVIDSQTPDAWTDNIYNGWLDALRQLSPPTTAAAFPQCMRTRGWAMKSVNTQLASWTHLRHDTILYVKQTYTAGGTCVYPAGFVEPVPTFWRRMNLLATHARDLLATIPMSGPGYYQDRYGQGVTFTRDLGTQKTNQMTFLSRFADTMTMLETLAGKELRQAPFATNEVAFLKNVVETYWDYFGLRYTGWYPGLYYWDTEGFDAPSDTLAISKGLSLLPRDATKWDALVADVHTDAADDVTGDPGMILHEAVGSVACLVAAVDSRPDRAIYLGPLLSHYEFEEPLGTRLNDDEWKARLSAGQAPPPPDWTTDYYLP